MLRWPAMAMAFGLASSLLALPFLLAGRRPAGDPDPRPNRRRLFRPASVEPAVGARLP